MISSSSSSQLLCPCKNIRKSIRSTLQQAFLVSRSSREAVEAGRMDSEVWGTFILLQVLQRVLGLCGAFFQEQCILAICFNSGRKYQEEGQHTKQLCSPEEISSVIQAIQGNFFVLIPSFEGFFFSSLP